MSGVRRLALYSVGPESGGAALYNNEKVKESPGEEWILYPRYADGITGPYLQVHEPAAPVEVERMHEVTGYDA